MIGVVILGAIASVALVGLLVLVRQPADVRRTVRWSGLVITLLVVAALAPFTVRDSGWAAVFLLGVPVLGAALPVLAGRFPRTAGLAALIDFVAAIVIGGWGLLLALGIGTAFLPVALLFLACATISPAQRPSPTG